MYGFRTRATRLVAAFATVTTALVFAVAGPASATVKTTSAIATVTQSPTVSTPGFNTACTVAKKTQNCAEIRTQTQVGSYMVLGGSFQQVLDPTGKPLIDPATGQAIALNNLALVDTTNNNAVVTTFKHKFNGEVLATAVSADHNTLYVGASSPRSTANRSSTWWPSASPRARVSARSCRCGRSAGSWSPTRRSRTPLTPSAAASAPCSSGRR